MPVRRIRQLWTLFLWPDARQAAVHAIAETELAVVEAVGVGLAFALAGAAGVSGGKLVPRGTLVRLNFCTVIDSIVQKTTSSLYRINNIMEVQLHKN